MTKILLWIVVIFVVLFGLRLLNVAKAKRRSGASGRSPARHRPAETMVRCARCGVYLPQKDATAGPAGLDLRRPRAAREPR